MLTFRVMFILVIVEAEFTLNCNSSPALTAVDPHPERERSSFFCAVAKVGLSEPAIEAVVGNPAYVLRKTSTTAEPLWSAVITHPVRVHARGIESCPFTPVDTAEPPPSITYVIAAVREVVEPVKVTLPKLSEEIAMPDPWMKFRAVWLKLGVPLVLSTRAVVPAVPTLPRL